MKHKIIFIALDCSISKAKSIIKSIPKINSKKYKLALKIGYQIFFAKRGREFIKSIKNFEIFLDIKAYDIENTIKNAMLSIKDLSNVEYISVHASSGIKALKVAKKFAGNKKILAVTTLTSFNQKNLIEIGYKKKLSDLVFLQAKNAKKAGCFGVICSGHESLKIYKKLKINTITPGIRLPGSKLNEQKRVSTPLKAFINSKAYGIVIGRSITGNIKKNINKLLTHLGE